MANIGTALIGQDPRQMQLPRFNPQQQAAMDWYRQTGQQQYQAPQFDFNPIEQQARQDYAKKTAPLIANRFYGMSGSNSWASGLDGEMNESAQNLESNLAALKAQYAYQQQQQQQQNALQLMQLGMQPSHENIYIPGTGGILGGLADVAGPYAAKYGPLAALEAYGMGPWAKPAKEGVPGATDTTQALNSVGDPVNAVGPSAGAVNELAAPAAGGAAATAATKPGWGATLAGIGKSVAGTAGALGSAGILPLGITAGALLAGAKHWVDKKTFDKDWEEARQLYMAGKRPAPPTKPKDFYAQEKQIYDNYMQARGR